MICISVFIVQTNQSKKIVLAPKLKEKLSACKAGIDCHWLDKNYSVYDQQALNFRKKKTIKWKL